jgi:hypothetical protein
MKQYMEILNETIFSDPRSRRPIKTIVERIESIFTSVNRETYQSFLNSLLQETPAKKETTPQLLEEITEEIPETILGLAEDV